ncbi:CLUMA_CG015206, isoform A [Clunio marinus]|uniref:CLUMA_CG015206, isoform A n=1 Tax=Clunio marinus TaxID=568069 RepID=A0A1J1IQ66_9DIPT|nr:CLUMA_CG015206, isoform A [Clunio marinus]
MNKWTGKVAVVTGASSGIGSAIVKDLAKRGVNVIGLARRVELIEEISNSLGEVLGIIYPRYCDVSDLNSIKETFKWIEEKFGIINILVNNAGIQSSTVTLDESNVGTENINKVIDTNFTGAVHCAREGIRLIKKSNDYGVVININSVLGHSIPFGEFSHSVYPATKYALKAISETLRQELIVQNNMKIRVTNLSPGCVKTNIFLAAGVDPNADVFKVLPHLNVENISQAVLYILEAPYGVNITELTIKPVGEKF